MERKRKMHEKLYSHLFTCVRIVVFFTILFVAFNVIVRKINSVVIRLQPC